MLTLLSFLKIPNILNILNIPPLLLLEKHISSWEKLFLSIQKSLKKIQKPHRNPPGPLNTASSSRGDPWDERPGVHRSKPPHPWMPSLGGSSPKDAPIGFDPHISTKCLRPLKGILFDLFFGFSLIKPQSSLVGPGRRKTSFRFVKSKCHTTHVFLSVWGKYPLCRTEM